jgi:hypothetical protein
MESARDKITGEIIDAEQLWIIRPVDKTRYICRGCDITVTPSSYEPHNKVRPYFSARKTQHQPDCDVDGEAKLVEQAKKTRVSTPLEGFPGAFPDKLQLRETRPVADNGNATSSPQASTGKPAGSSGSVATGQKERRWTAQTIRPLCKTFINYPFDRHLPLTIPGLRGTTYEQIFWRLKQNEITRYRESRLFYVPISWSKPVQTDDELEIKLGAGEWQEKKLTRPYRVRVQWKDWSAAKRNYTLKEIEVARQEAIDANKSGASEKGWLFFLGRQDDADDSLFLVDDHRLICCVVADITYPPKT